MQDWQKMGAFIGNIDAKLDAKGRAFMPAAFRKILQLSGESRLILQKDVYKDCLILSPEKTWEEKMRNLRTRLNELDEEEQELFRQFSWLVEILEIDSNGRILIPKKYLQMTNISNNVCFVGMIDTVEMWNPEQLTKSMLNAQDFKNRVKKTLGSKPANEKSD